MQVVSHGDASEILAGDGKAQVNKQGDIASGCTEQIWERKHSVGPEPEPWEETLSKVVPCTVPHPNVWAPEGAGGGSTRVQHEDNVITKLQSKDQLWLCAFCFWGALT